MCSSDLKGLEVIEASRLFGMPASKIGVVVHPQSIVHAFVVFTDGSVKAQLAAPDMRLPIGYALAYPDRLTWSPFSKDEHASRLEQIGAKAGAAELLYHFQTPDCERFPCLRLAFEALEKGGTAPAALSAANEVAVDAFIEGRVRFGEIARIVERVMDEMEAGELTLDGVRRADREARERAAALAGTVTT